MKSTIVLSLLSGALALPAPSSAPAHKKVSLGKNHMLTRANGAANVPGVLASLNSTLIKYGKQPLPYYEPVAQQQAEQAAERRKAKAKRQSNAALTDQYVSPSEDAAYYGSVTIGSGDGSPQTFSLCVHLHSKPWLPGRRPTRTNFWKIGYLTLVPRTSGSLVPIVGFSRVAYTPPNTIKAVPILARPRASNTAPARPLARIMWTT